VEVERLPGRWMRGAAITACSAAACCNRPTSSPRLLPSIPTVFVPVASHQRGRASNRKRGEERERKREG